MSKYVGCRAGEGRMGDLAHFMALTRLSEARRQTIKTLPMLHSY